MFLHRAFRYAKTPSDFPMAEPFQATKDKDLTCSFRQLSYGAAQTFQLTPCVRFVFR